MNVSSVISIRDQGALDLVQSLLHQGIAVRIQVSGRSMRPLLNGGELLEIAPRNARHLRAGDIVLFRDQHGNPLLHRLIWRRHSNQILHLLTKGDACTGFDSLVSSEQVFGCVQRIFIESTTVDLQTPFMRLSAYGLVARSLLLYALRRIGRVLKKKQLH